MHNERGNRHPVTIMYYSVYIDHQPLFIPLKVSAQYLLTSMVRFFPIVDRAYLFGLIYCLLAVTHMIRSILVLGFFGLLVDPVGAQSLTNQADHAFDPLTYAKIAGLYERPLTSPSSETDAEQWAAKARLAYSYKQARDTKNAERAYRELIAEGASSPDYALYHLYYAQALLANGNYREAGAVYQQYHALQPVNKPGPLSAAVAHSPAPPSTGPAIGSVTGRVSRAGMQLRLHSSPRWVPTPLNF